MIRIQTPATSANLGPGLDTLGIAFDLYNSFTVSSSEEDVLVNVPQRFQNADNLFLKGYRAGCAALGIHDHVSVQVETGIPVSRGLGSSASFYTAGVFAAGALHGNALSKDDILDIVSGLEGHPDNAAPCLLGGLTASFTEDGHTHAEKLPVSEKLRFTLLWPQEELTTSKSRSVLPESYCRADVSSSLARVLFMARGMETGDMKLIRVAGRDVLHQPYRRELIDGYDEVKRIVEKDTGGTLVLSGSGSACLLISLYPLHKEAIRELKTRYKRQVQPVTVCHTGTVMTGV